MQKITPFLWFDTQAEEAVQFYVSLFKNSKITSTTHYSDEVPGPKSKVMSLTFELEGQKFMAINGGPGVFTFSGAISFFVSCDSQEEVDHFWNALTEGGDESAQQCGWAKDRFGVTWQIVPSILGDMMQDSDPEKVQRVTHAMLQMKKLDVAALQKAYNGE